jgi:hypothetical protein
MSVSSSPSAPRPITAAEALAQSESALRALPEAQVIRDAKVPASHAFHVVTAAVQHLEVHRAELVALCGPDTAELLDRLPIIAAAAQEASIHVLATATGNAVPAARKAARHQHQLVLGDARSLVLRGLLAESAVERLRVAVSDAQLIAALAGLKVLFVREWPRIAAHTPLTLEALDEAMRAGQRLRDGLLARMVGRALHDARDLHARAMTRLLADYDELRRRVHYLRWHVGDADRLAPSLYARRQKRRRAERPDEGATGEGRPIG